ncbi:type II/IV secretion system protein, partial [Candidatus Saccharibacteria bacterium]|nr:type II/IV secretion system protein [Candidatus Saccharibacteria bacterium]NIV04172.1 type II/IV secretion system protein [Calditrichia bacterium]NIV72621.1 type II/IV secretion system protein [Calditrichia bacterium]NIV99758.1 type II/IV secretion system protein [Candidatus Saccharibacteria bacterium]NIW80119.1 type II/IV secretion system protein [Calditrichia bacterium]
VSFDVLEKALKIKRREEGTARRNLAQILVEDFEVERDSVFRELANQYGFRNLKFSHTLFKNDNADIIK